MFCHLNYTIDKKFLRDYFFENIQKAKTHKTATGYELTFWKKLFNIEKIVEPIVEDLGLIGLNILPRFSFQEKNTILPLHVDIDRIVGINFNLMDNDIPVIWMNDKPFAYQGCLIDVGAIKHYVIADNVDRLVLKFAIRNNWNEIFTRLLYKGKIDIENTMSCNPNYQSYQSILRKDDEKYVIK
jgi:hypothetical protein